MLIDILIDSMRGFFIASVYCFSNTEVRQEITRQYRRRCINNELRRPTRFRNNSRRSSDIRRASSISRMSLSATNNTALTNPQISRNGTINGSHTRTSVVSCSYYLYRSFRSSRSSQRGDTSFTMG